MPNNVYKVSLLLMALSYLCLPKNTLSQQPQSLVVTYTYFQNSKSGKSTYLISVADSTRAFVFFAKDSIHNHIADMKKKVIYHHSSYFLKDSSKMYKAANYVFGAYLIEIPFTDFNYIKTDKQKQILGYRCSQYICKTQDGDRIEVWCTDSIGNFYSKIFAPGAPHVVLQMKYHLKNRNINLFYEAINLNLVNTSVIVPNTEVVLTKEGAIKYRKGTHKLSELNINSKAIIKPGKNNIYSQ